MNATSIRQIIRWLRRKDSRMSDLTTERFFIFCHKKVVGTDLPLFSLAGQIKDFNERGIVPYYVVLFVKRYTLRSFICR